MGRIDCRTPARRRAERAMWGVLYTLIVGCGAMLGYVGLWSPEHSLAAGDDADARVPAATQRHAPARSEATGVNPSAPATPAPRANPGSTQPTDPNTFFGIPVE